MEITLGHSNNTSYVDLIIQKCMFEHKYDMDCKQALITLIELKTYTYVQPSLLKQLRKRHKIFQFFASYKYEK